MKNKKNHWTQNYCRGRIIILVISFYLLFRFLHRRIKLEVCSLDINKGLSSNQINTIFKDSQGFLWIGTVNGLNRFDGYSTRVFRKTADSAGSSLNNNIFRIYEDCQGRLLILSGEELWVFDTATERFLSDDELFNLNVDPSFGHCWNIRLNSNSLMVYHSRFGALWYNHQKKEGYTSSLRNRVEWMRLITDFGCSGFSRWNALAGEKWLSLAKVDVVAGELWKRFLPFPGFYLLQM